MARCNDCNKFVGLEPAEADAGDLEVDSDGHVAGTVTITNECADCSTEIKSADLEFGQEVDGAHEHRATHVTDFADVEFEIVDVDCDRVEKYEGKGRGQKHFYGAEVTCKVQCSCGKFQSEVTMTEYVQASYMDDCQ